MYTLTATQERVNQLHAAIALAMRNAPTQQVASTLARLMVWLEDEVAKQPQKEDADAGKNPA